MSTPVTAKKSVQSVVIFALGLAESATASEIYRALESAPIWSAADYLHRGLSNSFHAGDYATGRMRFETPIPFETLAETDDIEEALVSGLERGSSLINEAFCSALDRDVANRKLVDSEGETPGPTPLDGFGQPFKLLQLIKSRPFDAPFTQDLARELNDGWGWQPKT